MSSYLWTFWRKKKVDEAASSTSQPTPRAPHGGRQRPTEPAYLPQSTGSWGEVSVGYDRNGNFQFKATGLVGAAVVSVVTAIGVTATYGLFSIGHNIHTIIWSIAGACAVYKAVVTRFASGMNKEKMSAKDLALRYESAARANQAKECYVIVNLLTTMLTNIAAVYPKQLLEYAGKQVEQGKFLGAVLSSRISANFYEHQHDATGISNCCVMIENAAKAMFEQKTTDYQHLWINHLIPVITLLRDKISGLNVNKEVRVRAEAHCTNCLVNIYSMLGEYQLMEKTSNLGLQHLRSSLPLSTCMQYCVYGYLLLNLALSHHRREQHDPAINFYSQALEAFKLATDFPSQNDKRQLIAENERLLKDAMYLRRITS